jgi:RimJ/RimL family protein N-acetyltransferase
MKLVLGQDRPVTQWAARVIDIDVLGQPTHAFGLVDGRGKLRGCILLREITRHTADMHVYSEATITPNVVRQVFYLIFEVLRYGRLQTMCERSNWKSKKDTPRWGFKFDGVARDFFGPNKDSIRFVMRRSDCRWLAKPSARKTQENGHLQVA